MKKIITLCSLLLALMLVVTMFTACGDKTETESTTTNNETAVAVTNGFSAVVKDNEVVIKKGDSVFQVLSYPLNYENNLDLEYAKSHNEFIDMNFDGELDFYIAISSKDDVISYYCWLYNATSESFDFSVILSGLKNISIDSENHLVLSKSINGDSTSVVSYHWVDGELRLKKSYDSDKESIPEEITKGYEDNAIGTDKPTSSKNDKNETTSKVQSSGNSDKTTKPNKPTKPTKPTNSNKPTNPSKPSNTTTTAPKGDAVVLGTGSLNSDGWY